MSEVPRMIDIEVSHCVRCGEPVDDGSTFCEGCGGWEEEAGARPAFSPSHTNPPSRLQPVCLREEHFAELKEHGVPISSTCLVCALDSVCEWAKAHGSRLHGDSTHAIRRWAYEEASTMIVSEVQQFAKTALEEPKIFLGRWQLAAINWMHERMHRVVLGLNDVHDRLQRLRHTYLRETPNGEMAKDLTRIGMELAASIVLLEEIEG